MATRKVRIRRLKIALRTKSDSETNEAVIAKFMLEEGVSLRKVREYLRILKLASEIDEKIKI